MGVVKFQGGKRQSVQVGVVSVVVMVLALAAIPLMNGRYGFEGMWVGALAVAIVFGYGAFFYGRIAVNPFWIAVGPTGVQVAMGHDLGY